MEIKFLSARGGKGFSLLAGINRNVVPSHVTKMANSINKIGIIRAVIIATLDFINGKKEQYIIDGQHLYHACIRNNQNIPYMEIPVKITNMVDLVETIALLNTSSKSWLLTDYIIAWQPVNSDYKKLSVFYNTYDIELSQIASLLQKGFINNKAMGNSMAKYIKDGSFTINNEDQCIKILDNITEILRIIPRMNRACNSLFISSYVELYKQYESSYNHKKFLKHLQTNKSDFLLATQDTDKIKELLQKLI